jgi:DNA-binding CsgD family transcriptional regulator
MRWQAAQLFVPMSPQAFAPFDGLEGLCALARDEDFRLLWCNETYARILGADRATLIGSTPEDLLPAHFATDRKTQMRTALAEGRVVSFYQLWHGSRWHNRVWPLDPAAFDREGYFIIMNKSVDPAEPPSEGPPVLLTRAHDLGDLGVLSKRELEVLYYLAGGLTINQIATELFRSPKTIGRHAENIHRKMGYINRAELVRDATSRGLVAFTTQEWASLVKAS